MTATVFLSYRHESDEHSERVRALADRLRQSLAAAGISVTLDRFQPAGGPDQGWAKWSADQVRHSTRVVMVLTPGYVESMLADDLEPTSGRGAAWEARAIYHELYQSRGITSKYRALAFSEESSVALPAEIGSIHTFRSPEDEDDLVAWIRGALALPPTENRIRIASPAPKARTSRPKLSPWLLGGMAGLIGLVLILGSYYGVPGSRNSVVQQDPEFQRMVKMVEDLQKQLPQPLSPDRIEQEAESRTETPNRYRDNTYYWPVGSTIRVGFLGGEKAIHDKVLSIAREWTKYANVTFVRAEPKDAEVRVSFDNTGEWSYLGTQSLTVPMTAPTANLGPPSVDFDNELESRQLTLHAFGHVLGLIHEYQTPAAASQVNLENAFAYFSGPPNHWTREMVEANYRPLENAGGLYADKPFDPYSVMLHRLPADVMNSGKTFDPGDQLSPGDIAFVRKLYPGR